MKLKYYLRGLGIGIFVTAIVMGIAFGNKKTLTNEEIIKQAKELGMVMKDDSLFTAEDSEAEISEEVEEEELNGAITDATQNDEVTALPQSTPGTDTATVESVEDSNTTKAVEPKEDEANLPKTNAATNETTADTASTNAETADANATDATPAVTEYQFTISNGMPSDKVARLLADNGMVDDAVAFNQYLVSNGYDKRIRVGQFTVNNNMDYKQISKIITGK